MNSFARYGLYLTLQELSSPPDRTDLDEIVHYLFDDNDFKDEIFREVGKSIYLSEVSYFKSLIDTFENIINDLGDKTVMDYVKHPLWQDLIKQALVTERKMLENGVERPEE